MRSREEIEKYIYDEEVLTPMDRNIQLTILEVLLDIRDLLQPRRVIVGEIDLPKLNMKEILEECGRHSKCPNAPFIEPDKKGGTQQ